VKFAFSKPTKPGDDTRQLFSNFRSIGYEGLQLKAGQYTGYLDQRDRFLEEYGDQPGAASALIIGGALDEDGVARLRKIMAFGKAIGTRIIVFCHGVAHAGLAANDIRGFAKRLSELGKEARDHGLRLSLHNHFNQPVMHRGDFDVFFGAVADGAVGLTLDTAHLVKSGVSDVAEVIRAMAPVIDNFHIKDFSGGQFKVLGEGEINFTPIFAVIREIGYDGWVSTDEESGADLLPAMKQCLRFMQEGLRRG